MDADQSKQVDADQSKQVDADQSKQVDADQSKQVDADQSKQVDADQSKQVDADQSKQVDADQSKQVDAEQIKQVDADQSKQLDADQSKQLDADQSKQVDADQSKQVNADQSKQVDADQSKQVKTKRRRTRRSKKLQPKNALNSEATLQGTGKKKALAPKRPSAKSKKKPEQTSDEPEKEDTFVADDLYIPKNLQKQIDEITMAKIPDTATDLFTPNLATSKLESFMTKSTQSGFGINAQDIASTSLEQDQEMDGFFLDDLKKRKARIDFKFKQKLRRKLPAYKMEQDVVNLIENNQVVILTGHTGCGKTTQVPQFILDSYIESNKGSTCKIVCAQQRRICTVGVAEHVASERCVPCGGEYSEVGYHIMLERKIPRAIGSILFCTTGVILRQLQSNSLLQGISHLIIDDVHEHDILTDFLLLNLRDILKENQSLKLILMSATMKAEEFAQYFGECPKIEIPGHCHEVTEFYLEDMIQLTGYTAQEKLFRYKGEQIPKDVKYEEEKNLYIKEIANKYYAPTITALRKWNEEVLDFGLILEIIRYIIGQRQEGTILIFLPGWQEINEMYKHIIHTFPWINRRNLIPLHSRTSTRFQRNVLNKLTKGNLKIILSTNIAETSITVEDCTVVIDCGKLKMKSYDPERNLHILKPQWAAKSNVTQRRGRAGRTVPGKCYHMFTRKKFDLLEEFPIPEMKRINLEQQILDIKILKKGSPAEFLERAMNPPTAKAIEVSIRTLQNLGALTADGELTPMGYFLAKLPVNVCVGKMILYGALFSCLDPILCIAASLSFKDPFVLPIYKIRELEIRKRELSRSMESDLLLYAFAVEDWETIDDPNERHFFAMDYGLDNKILNMLIDLRNKYAYYLKNFGFLDVADPLLPAYNRNSDNPDLIKAVLCAALYPNAAQIIPRKHPFHALKALTKNDGEVTIHPSSVNAFVSSEGMRYLLYNYKMKSSKIFIHDTSSIGLNALLLFGGQLKMLEKDTGCILSMDEWLEVNGSETNIKLIMSLKNKLENILEQKILKPSVLDWKDRNDSDMKVLHCVTKLVSGYFS